MSSANVTFNNKKILEVMRIRSPDPYLAEVCAALSFVFRLARDDWSMYQCGDAV